MTQELEMPYPGYLATVLQELQSKIAAAEPVRSPHQGAPEELAAAITAAVEKVGDDLVALSHDIHAHPELAFDEHHAVEAAAKLLARHGHEVELGVYGLPTAFRAVVGSGCPTVAVLAEYDALPEIGHACGHNVICATAVGAFLALAEMTGDLDGSIVLLGTPAEEGGGGKELMALEGAFDDIDAVVMLHPAGLDVAEHTWLGGRFVDVIYHGLATHASATPFLGRNALDAAVTAYQSMAQLRQHLLPSDRVHGIITDGGQKSNIVPERAALSFCIRSAELATLATLADRATDIFLAAATATGTTAELTWDTTPAYLPVRNNSALAARWATNQARRGRQSLPRGIMPEGMAGSTDLGNVSVRVPSIHPLLAIAPPYISIHHPAFTGYACSPEADVGVLDGAIGLAVTAADYLTDCDLRTAVDAEFEAAGGRYDADGAS